MQYSSLLRSFGELRDYKTIIDKFLFVYNAN